MFPRFLIAMSFLLIPFALSAQVENAPAVLPEGVHVDSSGRYYQQADLPVYFFISPTKNREDAVRLKGTSKYADPMYLDGHGVHNFRHRDTEKGIDINFKIYGDGKAPVSSSKYQGAPVYRKRGVTYCGKGLKINVSTKDEMSGMKELYDAVDDEDFGSYSGPRAFDREKEYSYRYYGEDNVGNKEKPKTKEFTVDLSAPMSSHRTIGERFEQILSPRTTVNISSVDGLSGVKQLYYQIDDGTPKPYYSNIKLSKLSDGNHTITYWAEDNVKNVEEKKTFDFYLDKRAPLVTAEILGDRFVYGGKNFFSGRTKLKLTAMDNKSGVSEIFYSVDGSGYQIYNEPLYMPSKSGYHIVRYYAVDKVGNKGSGQYEKNVTSMYMDLTGPSLSNTFEGPTFRLRDTIFVNKETKIKLRAQDPESGIQKITYSIDGGAEQDYNKPFSVPENGFHRITFTGYDNVNNSNIGDFHFIEDNEGPKVFFHFSIAPIKRKEHEGEKLDVYARHMVLFLAATDELVGYNRIFYSINDGTYKMYGAPVKGFRAGQLYKIRVKASDRLGNVFEQTIKFFTE